MSEIIFTERPFRFLDMPAELRNRVYELLLTNTRDPSDRVIHGNDLQRRCALRRDPSSKSKMLQRISVKEEALFYNFANSTPATKARLAKPVSGIPELLETGILQACKQTYREGKHILYTLNSFDAIMEHFPSRSTLSATGNEFPQGVDISRIRYLRLEVQLCKPDYSYTTPVILRDSFAPLRNMHGLVSLQIVVTFRNEWGPDLEKESIMDAALFNRCWSITTIYNEAMRSLISSIPKNVEKVTWGLTKAQKEVGDYGGIGVAKGCVLRKIWKTYEGLRGTRTICTVNWKRRRVGHLPIDGDGEDSDEEMEEEK
jgi:hypothetical protein